MSKSIIKQQTALEERIFTIRKVQVMLDYHLSELFGVETKRINEQVKRNIKRFPENFMFQLSPDEWENLKSQNAIAKLNEFLWSQNATAKRRTIPYVYTEGELIEKVVAANFALTTQHGAMKGKTQILKTDLHDRT